MTTIMSDAVGRMTEVATSELEVIEMERDETYCGYVVTEGGTVLLQVPCDNNWGFVLCDDDQEWPGGFGVASRWEAIADDDPRVTPEIRDRLQFHLNAYRQPGV
jgi:hypothetical protein